jgi:hypothetical protein
LELSQGAFRIVNAHFVGEASALLIEGIQHGELLERTGLDSGDALRSSAILSLQRSRTRQTVKTGSASGPHTARRSHRQQLGTAQTVSDARIRKMLSP